MKYDIILVHYYFDPVALLIRLFTHSYWNHCAWLLNDQLIIESKRNGIKINKINKYNNPFLYKTKYIQLYNLSNEQKNKINNLLMNQIKEHNYFLRVWKFISIALKINTTIDIPTCSEFIANALQQVNYPITKESKYYYPQDFAESEEILWNIKQS